jgi:lysozyme family protein
MFSVKPYPPRQGAAPIQPVDAPRSSVAKKTGLGAALAMIAATIAIEGGWVNHPADPGGETNMGITKKVAVRNGYTGPMRKLPREMATNIYYREYLVGPGFEPLIAVDAAVTEELFDTTVNMGPARPTRWFGEATAQLCGITRPWTSIGAVIDGYRACQPRIGAATLCRRMLDALDARQRAEYDRLVRVNRKLRVFYRGWINNRIGNVDRKKCGKGA